MNNQFKVLTGYDTKTGTCLVIKKDGIRKVEYIDCNWYFYILKSDYETAQPIIEKYRQNKLVFGVTVGNQYVKIHSQRETKIEPSIDSLRRDLWTVGVDVFEFDLNKTKRYIIDNNIEIENDLSILYFDIETDDTIGNIEVGRDRIISWAATDGNKTYYQTGDEATILKKFVSLIKKYDIISGWNSEFFDLPYIQMRCEKHNIKYQWKTILHVDLYQRCFKIFGYEANIIGLKNFSLNEIAKAFLQETKTDLDHVKIHILEKEDPKLLKEYNIQDAKLLYKLDSKLSIIPLMIQECVWTGCFLNKFYIGELLDNYILREAKKQNKILHSRPSDIQYAEYEQISIKGGYVAEPIKGLYENVQVCDFKSLYPSIIVGWNIGIDSLNQVLSEQGHASLLAFLDNRKIEDVSYEEWTAFLKSEKQKLDPNNEHVQTGNNAFFSKKANSFISELVQKLLDERKEYKKKLKVLQFDTTEYNNTYAAERVVKEMANSMFGITCDKRSRYFNQFVSEGITYSGQLLNKMSSHIATTLGLKSIYGDTDSIFLVDAVDMDKQIIEINDLLKSTLDTEYGLHRNIVYLEFEKTFSKFILLEKKRYTGLLSMKDGKEINKIFSRGTEDAKKSSIKLSKKTYLELIDIIFKDNSDENVIKYIEQLRHHVLYEEIDLKDILLITKVSKTIDSYKTLPLAARLAKRLIEEKKILPIVESEKKVGTRLEYVIVKREDKNEGLLLEEANGEFDRDYYWRVQIFAPLRRVLDCTHPHIDWSTYEDDPANPKQSPKNKKIILQESANQKLF